MLFDVTPVTYGHMVVWTLKTSDTKPNIPDIVYTGVATEKMNGLKAFTGADVFLIPGDCFDMANL